MTAPCHIGTPVLYAARANACAAIGLTSRSNTATSSALEPYSVKGPLATARPANSGNAPAVIVLEEHWIRV